VFRSVIKAEHALEKQTLNATSAATITPATVTAVTTIRIIIITIKVK
jgi:hypothetical protein